MPFWSRCVAATAVCLVLQACGQPADEQPANGFEANAATVRPFPVAEPPLDRSTLLIAAMRAASSHAAGIDDSAAQRTLDGKRFELRLRFGCSEAEPEESRGWRFDEARRTLRLRVTNDLSAEDPLIAAAAGDAESVEGLWLRRPWLLTASCPRPVAVPASDAEDEAEEEENAITAASAAPPAPAAPRIGVAQFFSAADARTARREQRPYEATVVLGEGQKPSDQGYNFVVSGRLRALPNRRVISCSSQHADAPPDCVISVRIDRTWIERPDTGELLAEWHGG